MPSWKTRLNQPQLTRQNSKVMEECETFDIKVANFKSFEFLLQVTISPVKTYPFALTPPKEHSPFRELSPSGTDSTDVREAALGFHRNAGEVTQAAFGPAGSGWWAAEGNHSSPPSNSQGTRCVWMRVSLFAPR